MALEDILQHIKREAKEKIEKLELEFKEKERELEAKYEKKQKEVDEEMNKKIKEKSAKIMEKAETLAEMEHKGALLKAKRQILEDTLQETVAKLSESDRYEEIITEMLKNSPLDDENVALVPAKGKEDETKKAIKASGKKYFLSEKSGNFLGGFILKTDKIEIDNSFETIVKEQFREELEIELAKLLF